MEAQYKVNGVELVVYRTPKWLPEDDQYADPDTRDAWEDPERVTLTFTESDHTVWWKGSADGPEDKGAPLVRIVLAGVNYPQVSGIRVTMAFQDKARMGAFLAMLDAYHSFVEVSTGEEADMWDGFRMELQRMYDSVPDRSADL